MKKTVCFILLMSMMLLSSCYIVVPDSWAAYEVPLKSLYTYDTFENDTWLVVGRNLINKVDGSVCALNAYDEAFNEKMMYSYRVYAYDYQFEESYLKEYSLLKATSMGETFYLKCVITYGYDGQEIKRAYKGDWPGDWIPEKEMKASYKTMPYITETFYFEAKNGHGYLMEEDKTQERQAFLKLIMERYDVLEDADRETVVGLVRPMGEEIWFSAVVTDSYGTVKEPFPTLGGVDRSEIVSYDPKTNEMKTVYAYNKKAHQIIDFDENGIYVLDQHNQLLRVDFESGKSTVIYHFSTGVYDFDITDPYICAWDGRSDEIYFVYEKGGSVIVADFVRGEKS